MPRNRRVSIPDATCCIAGRLSQSLQQSAQRLDCALIDRRPTGCLWGAKVAVCLFQRRMTNQDRIGAALLEGTQSRLRIRSAEQAIAVTENSTQVAGHQLVVANRHECSGEHCPRRRKRCVTWHSSSFPWPKAPKTHGAQDPWRSRPMALKNRLIFRLGTLRATRQATPCIPAVGSPSGYRSASACTCTEWVNPDYKSR